MSAVTGRHRPPGMTNIITIELPATDPEEAVRMLRRELRAARRRRADARRTAGFATVRLLAGVETTHGLASEFPR